MMHIMCLVHLICDFINQIIFHEATFLNRNKYHRDVLELFCCWYLYGIYTKEESCALYVGQWALTVSTSTQK
jgi:hypothetical protein